MTRWLVWSLVAIVIVAVVAPRFFGSSDEEQAQRIKIYSSVDACKAEQSVQQCNEAFLGAQQQHQTTAPRYPAADSCEAQYGAGACVPYRDPGGGSWFIPAMMGFMIGHALSGPSLLYHPVYVDRFGGAFSGGNSLGYFRGNCGGPSSNWDCGGRASFSSGYVYSGGGGASSSRSGVWSNSSAYRAETVTVSRGGFGGSASIGKPLASAGGGRVGVSSGSVSRGGFGATASSAAGRGG